MSQLAPNWFVQEYKTNVRQVYATEGHVLKNAVTPEGRIDGKTAFFPVGGRVKAMPLKRGSNATPNNPDRQFVQVDLGDYQVFDEIQYTDLTKMTINERSQVQTEGARALGVNSDVLIYNAMTATTNIASQTTGAGADITLADAMTAIQKLQARAVRGPYFALIPTIWFAVFMTYKQFSNSQWAGDAGIVFPKGIMSKYWFGCYWIAQPESDTDSLFNIPSANQADGFAWGKEAIGYSSNYDDQTFIAWDNRATCWTVNMVQQAASKVLLPTGVQRMRFATNTTITASAN